MKEEAVFIILRNKDKLLLYLRDNKPSISHPNYWSFIGGKIEKNETPLEALNREIKEELGLKIKNIEFVDKIELKVEKTGKKLKIFGYFKDSSNHLNKYEITTLGKRFYFDKILCFFKGRISKEIKELNLTEGQKLGYFSFDELESLNIIPPFKEFVLRNKEKFI